MTARGSAAAGSAAFPTTGSAATAVAFGVSVAGSGATDAGGGDAGGGAGSAINEVLATGESTVAEPGEDTGTSATTAVRSMSPRFCFSSGDRKREPSQRKM